MALHGSRLTRINIWEYTNEELGLPADYDRDKINEVSFYKPPEYVVDTLEGWMLRNPIKPRPKPPVYKLSAEGRAKARAIMNRFVSEGCGRIETEIKEDRVAERYARLSRPVSQRETDKWKDKPLTKEMLDDLLEHPKCCDLFAIIAEKLT